MAKHETYPWCNSEAWLKLHTHGHVIKHQDGLLARCGGPSICQVCQVEQELVRLIEDCVELYQHDR